MVTKKDGVYTGADRGRGREALLACSKQLRRYNLFNALQEKVATADLIGKIGYLCKAIRWGYNDNIKLSELLRDADMELFRSMLHSTHCIHQLRYVPQ